MVAWRRLWLVEVQAEPRKTVVRSILPLRQEAGMTLRYKYIVFTVRVRRNQAAGPTVDQQNHDLRRRAMLTSSSTSLRIDIRRNTSDRYVS